MRTVAQPGAWAASPGRPWHGACNMLRHSTVSSTSRLVPLFSSAAVAERATDARSEKKICTWCARGGRGKAPRAATTAATICYCYENYYEYAYASASTSLYCYCRHYYYYYYYYCYCYYYYDLHQFFSLVSFYCCTWHSRATPSLPLSSKGSKWT